MTSQAIDESVGILPFLGDPAFVSSSFVIASPNLQLFFRELGLISRRLGHSENGKVRFRGSKGFMGFREGSSGLRGGDSAGFAKIDWN